ncbi:MAG: thiosulfate sulfurtransferase GlpE [Candidatus Neomarinimicrobiota bacterium]|nr:thiosulfate sulfurtransferase GlpE [Candidatus Neomarinimicrobiota bacterium]|tara:strand:+ start:126 stop:428 length:303 start_codon:yes stop_codon:yes gene_type:complete
MHYKCIHVQKAQELLNDPGTVIVDIRDKVSFQAGNIPNSINLSNEDIVDFLDSTDRKAPLLIYCYHGINSKDAAEYFVNNGFHTVFSLDGGYSEFSQQKL